MKKLKIGIIGCGFIGIGKHLTTIAKDPDAEVVAFCDIISDRAREAARKFGSSDALVCEDYREKCYNVMILMQFMSVLRITHTKR